jgi:hypothetical protein
MLCEGDGLQLNICACLSLEMALKSASLDHSITCRTGKMYEKKGNLTVINFKYQMMRLPVDFSADITLVSF